MARKAEFVFFIFLLISFYFLLEKTILVNNRDKKDFNELINDNCNFKNITHTVKQKRKNIQKDIYFNNGKERYHTKITSLSSEIDLSVINKKVKATEVLHDIEFWMQEKINNNSQKVKYCNAKYGKYFFPSHRFISDEVNLSFFHSKGKELSDMSDANDILMKATAKHVFFKLNPKGASFQAEHIKARLPEKLNQGIKKRVFNASNKKPKESI